MPHPDPARTLINLPQPKLTITKKEVHALVDGDTSGLYTDEMAPSRRALSNPCYARLHPVGSAARPWTDRRSCSCNPSRKRTSGIFFPRLILRGKHPALFHAKTDKGSFSRIYSSQPIFLLSWPRSELFNRMIPIKKNYFQQNVTGAAASVTEIIILLSVAFWRKPRDDRR